MASHRVSRHWTVLYDGKHHGSISQATLEASTYNRACRHALLPTGGRPLPSQTTAGRTDSMYLGWDPHPMLDGWEVHQEVLATLDVYRLAV